MPRYALSQRALHWIIAVLVIGVIAGGKVIENFGFEGLRDTFGLDATNAIYTYHKTFGILILALMLVRLALKLRLGKPAYEPPLTRFEHVASNAVHGLFYGLLILMPVLGWLATGAGDFPVQFFSWNLPPILPVDKALSETLYGLHAIVGNAILTLILVHVGAAIWHAAVKKDGVFRRMV